MIWAARCAGYLLVALVTAAILDMDNGQAIGIMALVLAARPFPRTETTP